MRIGIDAHHLDGKPQGSRTYLIQLLRALAGLGSEDTLHVYSFDPEATRRTLELSGIHHHRLFPASARLRLPFVVPVLEMRDRLSVFHSQYIAPPFSFVPEVVTIHDVLFESHPELFEGAFSERSIRLIRRSARRAHVVLTVSEFSRREICARYGLSEWKVVVTPNAVDHSKFHPVEQPSEDVRARYGLTDPFILSVGRLEPRKNLARLIRAFGRARARVDARLTLALAGATDFRFEAVLGEARALPEDAVRFLGPVPDADLPDLYRSAEALAYPSLVEGFGMPVLEAMACGTPVLTSTRGALPEVSGDAALAVEPEDEEAIASGLERILTDTDLRARLSKAGPGRAARFHWAETAHKTLAAYRRAAEGL